MLLKRHQKARPTNPPKPDSARFWVKRLALHATTKNTIHVTFKRGYILPTQRGFYYLLTVVIMFIWSVNYALSLGYAMTFFAVVLALLVAVLTVNNLTVINVSPLSNTSYFSGDPAFFRLAVHNPKTEASVALLARRNGLYSAPVTIVGNGQQIIHIPLDDCHRGRKNLGYLRLSSEYPIGIFRSWTWLYFDTSLLIYPLPKGDLPLPFLPEHQGIDEGQVDLQGAEDFNELKDYQPGDNLRHIVWKKLSQQKVRVKTFQDLAGQHCILNFNDPRLQTLSIEDKLSQLCQWVLDAEKIGTKYALYLPTKRMDFGIGSLHKSMCLEALACY